MDIKTIRTSIIHKLVVYRSNWIKEEKNMNDISEILRELLDRYSNTPELDQEFERMRREVDGFEADDIIGTLAHKAVESQDSYWDNYQEFGNNI